MVALGLYAGPPSEVAGSLRAAGIGFAELGGQLVVPAAEAAGVALAFHT